MESPLEEDSAAAASSSPLPQSAEPNCGGGGKAPSDAAVTNPESSDYETAPEEQAASTEEEEPVSAGDRGGAATESAAAVTATMLEAAADAKTRGNALFSTGQLSEASAEYRRGLAAIEGVDDAAVAPSVTFGAEELRRLDDADSAESSSSPLTRDDPDLAAVLHSNLALVLHRLSKHADSASHCTSSLEYDGTVAKVWYRRAQARESLGDDDDDDEGGVALEHWRGAEADLLRCQSLLSGGVGDDDGAKAATKASEKKSLRDAATALARVREKMREATKRSNSPAEAEAEAAAPSALASASRAPDDDEEMIPQLRGGSIPRRRDEAAPSSESKMSAVGAAVRAATDVFSLDQQTNDTDSDDGDDDGAPKSDTPPGSPSRPAPNGATGPAAAPAPAPVRPRPPPSRQRSDVVKLLHQSRRPREGEAFLLIEKGWWDAWCSHVDFFYDSMFKDAAAGAKGGGSKAGAGSEGAGEAKKRQREAWLLRLRAMQCLPPGACAPPPPPAPGSGSKKDGSDKKKKKGKGKKAADDDDDDSSTSSSDDDDDARLPPGPIDNSSLILKIGRDALEPHDEFFGEWTQPLPCPATAAATPVIPAAAAAAADTSSSADEKKDAPEDVGGAEHASVAGAPSIVDDAAAVPKVRLRPNLVRGHHYEILPREAYWALRRWYSEVDDSSSHPIHRRSSSVIPIPCSMSPRGSSVTDLRDLARTAAAAEETGRTRAGGASAPRLVLYPELQYSALPPDDFQKDGETTAANRPCGACRTLGARSKCTSCGLAYYCRRECQESHWPYHRKNCKTLTKARKKNGGAVEKFHGGITLRDDPHWGRVGLNNLGNTCFMNSAVQCLSHAAPLTRHFLTNRFTADLNTSNPLGTGGKLAQAYDTAMKELWLAHTNGGAAISPTALKRAIAIFAPRFAGANQHDAHEFLAYLLDGLHEDLNRVVNPPYVEMPDAKPGQRVSVAAAEGWDAHRIRNDSLVTDAFYGQFKSTCVCPKCDHVSVSFNAFNNVSLEIPQPERDPLEFTRTIPVLLFRDGMAGPPQRLGIDVRKNGAVADIRRAVAQLAGLAPANLALVDVYDHDVYDILQDNKGVNGIRNDDVIAAYEVDPQGAGGVIHVIANNRDAGAVAAARTRRRLAEAEGQAAEEKAAVDGAGGNAKEEGDNIKAGLFSFPFLTSFHADLSCREVWDRVWAQVERAAVPPNSNGREEESRAENVEAAKASLRIRINDNTGTARIGSFRAGDLDEGLDDRGDGSELGGDAAATAYLPRRSELSIGQALGEDCTKCFLFLSLEWNVPVRDAVDPRRFSAYVDHPSLIHALEKRRVYAQNAANRNSGGVSLHHCLSAFTRPERLDADNAWYCPTCKEHVRAMKTIELWRLPNVLVVHLKRFGSHHAFRREKLETFVDYPLEGLDMGRYCANAREGGKDIPETGRHNPNTSSSSSGGAGAPSTAEFVHDGIPAIYDLFAVTNHYGRMGFGHYTAFARRWNERGMDGSWALFDDSSVHDVGDGRGGGGRGGSVVSPAAYMLFYRRRIFS